MSCVISIVSSPAPLSALNAAYDSIIKEYGELFELRVFLTNHIQENRYAQGEFLDSIKDSKIILFDLRGNPDKAISLLQKVYESYRDIVLIPVFGGGPSVLSLLRMGSFNFKKINSKNPSDSISVNYRYIKRMTGIVDKLSAFLPVGSMKHVRNWIKCTQYWSNNGMDNLRELLLFVASEYAGINVKPKPPVVYNDVGFLSWPEQTRYKDLKSFLKNHPLSNKPTVLVVIFGGTTYDACISGAQELLYELSRTTNLIPFYTDGITTTEALHNYILSRGKLTTKIDAIISLQWFRLNGGPLGGDPAITLKLLEKVSAPFYTAITSYNRSVEEWKKDPHGIAPIEVLASVTLPELDGAIDPIFIFGLGISEENKVPTTQPVVERSQRLAQRVLKRISLRYKNNAQKKIALIIYNYPPGEENLGHASFLDVFESVEKIIRTLRDNGYTVTIPTDSIKDMFIKNGLLNNGNWISCKQSKQNAIRIPQPLYQKMYQKLPEEFRRNVEEIFGVMPGDIMVDNNDILIPAIQLDNILIGVQPARGYHSNPDLLYHDKNLPPHHQYIAFYRYIEDVFGADAVVHIGTHGTLEFTPGKEVALSGTDAPDVLIGNLPHIYLYHVVNASEAMIAKRRGYGQIITYTSPAFVPMELYDDYLELEDLISEYESQKIDNPGHAAMIWKKIKEKAEQLRLPTDTQEIHKTLQNYRRTIVPIGLHRFGDRMNDDTLLDYLSIIARYDREGVTGLPRLIAQNRGWSYEEILENDPSRLHELYHETRKIVEDWLRNRYEKTLPQGIQNTLKYIADVKERIEQSDELNNMLRALNGEYIIPNLAGDPIRTPEVYPTGRNAYQFDPTKIPSTTALKRGKEIAEETIRQYYLKHKKYPEMVSVILWGFETCKTYGETLGQIYGYLGVMLERGEGYYMKPVPIPLEELGRPRIDVTVNMCGFFRDLFPNQVRALDRAFHAVAELDEDLEKNAIRRHALNNFGEPLCRLFGPPPGEYGTKLTTMIESHKWKTEKELSEMFVKNMQYAYGENFSGIASFNTYIDCLKKTDVVVQIRDSHEFDITDLDHYYEFLGGVARTVYDIKGESPEIIVADTTQENIIVQDIKSAVKRGVVTRLLNPQWIEGVLKHDFHGGQEIANRVEYLIGLSALTQSVDSSIWSSVAEKFAFDNHMRQRLTENNPFAVLDIIKNLGEAIQRGYWNASDAEKDQLKKIRMNIEDFLESSNDN